MNLDCNFATQLFRLKRQKVDSDVQATGHKNVDQNRNVSQ